jgi:hypothetical protein
MVASRVRMIGSIDNASKLAWPEPYSFLFFFPWLLGLRLDQTDVECVGPVSFLTKWSGATFLPLLLVALLHCAAWVVQRRRPLAPAGAVDVARILSIVVSALVPSVVPFLAANGVKGVVCSTDASGRRWSLADPTLSCDQAGAFKGLGSLALALTILIILGMAVSSFMAERGGYQSLRAVDTAVGALVVMVGQLGQARAVGWTPTSALGCILALVSIGFFVAVRLEVGLEEGKTLSEGFETPAAVLRVLCYFADVAVLITGMVLETLRSNGAVIVPEALTAAGVMLIAITLPCWILLAHLMWVEPGQESEPLVLGAVAAAALAVLVSICVALAYQGPSPLHPVRIADALAIPAVITLIGLLYHVSHSFGALQAAAVYVGLVAVMQVTLIVSGVTLAGQGSACAYREEFGDPLKLVPGWSIAMLVSSALVVRGPPWIGWGDNASPPLIKVIAFLVLLSSVVVTLLAPVFVIGSASVYASERFDVLEAAGCPPLFARAGVVLGVAVIPVVAIVLAVRVGSPAG